MKKNYAVLLLTVVYMFLAPELVRAEPELLSAQEIIAYMDKYFEKRPLRDIDRELKDYQREEQGVYINYFRPLQNIIRGLRMEQDSSSKTAKIDFLTEIFGASRPRDQRYQKMVQDFTRILGKPFSVQPDRTIWKPSDDTAFFILKPGVSNGVYGVIYQYLVTEPDKKADSSSSKNTSTAKDDSSAGTNDTILNTVNNKEFAALLKIKSDYDPRYGAFAKKYADRTIEFDGNIYYMAHHGSYKTRYDFLIVAGNYSEDGSHYGPLFQFQNKNFTDLHVTGSDSIREGNNLHIVAKVEGYNESTGKIFLEPVSCKVRR
jgi:hypothetical protein